MIGRQNIGEFLNSENFLPIKIFNSFETKAQCYYNAGM